MNQNMVKNQMNPMMGQMNPMMGQMNPMMGQMNPMMGQMNPMMGMNQLNPMMGQMNQMNPMMGQMNPMMGMPPMVMGGGMGGMGMNMNLMTKKQKEEYKKFVRYQGYLMGKKLAEEKKRREKGNNPTTNTAIPETNNVPANTNAELTIKFVKVGNTTKIKMKADVMIAELLNKYSVKTGNTGTFTYKGSTLDINDCTTLSEKGMKNGDQITVS